MYVTLGAYTVCVAMCTPLQLENLITDLLDNCWRAGASQPSRPTGTISLFIYGVDVCRNVLRNSK